MEDTFFSIVIPTYNRAQLLPETVETILEQTYSNFEIIIVDDGSKDNTDKVIEEKYGNLQKVRYFKKKNEERGRARNFGFENSNGEYIIYFDSDDLMLPEHLKVLNTYIKKLNHPNFIATKHLLVDSHGNKSFNQAKNLKEGWYNYKDLIRGNWLASHFVVKKNNPNFIPFEEDRNYAILEDWMCLMMNLFKDQIYLIDQFTIHQRIHEGRSMNNNRIIIERRQKANQYLLDRLPFPANEVKQMNAFSYYFCAVHAYIENDRKLAKDLAKKAYQQGGMSKELFILISKLILGYYPKKAA